MYRKKTCAISLDLDAPSSLDLHSELTDTLDQDLDCEQHVNVIVWLKLAHDAMVDAHIADWRNVMRKC